jgi:uncharacterized protein
MKKIPFIQIHSSCNEKSIENVITLLEEGCTIPFIARYRKEKTGGLDEVVIGTIRDANRKYDEITSRQEVILSAIEGQGKLTDELAKRIRSCFDTNELEDIYLPFKQKKLTRGEKARKQGLEPLAKQIMAQRGGDPYYLAAKYVTGEIDSEEEAISGACDIIAEWMNEHTFVRAKLRQLFQRRSTIQTKLSKGKEEEAIKYRDYFEFSEPLHRTPSHRFLALYRAQREGLLTMRIFPQEEESLEIMRRTFVKGSDECSELVSKTVKDAYKRLLLPSLENETIAEKKTIADLDAIKIFSGNLRQLLLAPPLGNKRILAIDPGFRTGCKIVCLDEQGELMHNTTIFPHPPQKEYTQAQSKLAQLVQAYKIEAIAIGDGTAGRETEQLVKKTSFDRHVSVFVVREDGASIYSASPIARKEFPQYDVTVRGAVSIGRRLMDPLAELVKIDPKSIGVGQYQHEVNQNKLKEALDDVVLSSVNTVGVDVNTASPYLLSYVSGLGPSLADNIVAHRSEYGPFRSRRELQKVKRLGDKAFEQAAGFLRIPNCENPLDNSAVHPESYKHVERIARQSKLSVQELIGKSEILNRLKNSDFPEIDPFTFRDLIEELKKPGRDPRKTAAILEFDEKIKSIEDLCIGMTLPGIVTNVTAFGAFVNIGIKENGLIHKSNLSDSYVQDPSEHIALHQHVQVEVLEIDIPRKRIGLKRIK